MKKVAGAAIIGAMLVLMFSRCRSNAGFYKPHYPSVLKPSKPKKSKQVHFPQEIEMNVVETTEPIDSIESGDLASTSPDSVNLVSRGIDILREFETDVYDQKSAEEAHEHSRKLDKEADTEVMDSITNLESEDIHDEVPSPQVQTKKQVNQNSRTAILLIPILFVGGLIVVWAIIINALILAGILLLIIGFGCVMALIKSIVGVKEIRNNRETQKGIGLSVFAGLASVFGLILTGLLIYVVLVL